MKYSFIIPVYNAEQTIERCVESIENNTFHDFEIILIEDCSKDLSYKKCIELKSRYQNLTLLKNDRNHGVSYTRNRGLTEARGQYLLFCDSDDWIEPDYIESMDHYVDPDHMEQMVICGYWNHDEQASGRLDEIVWDTQEKHNLLSAKEDIIAVYEKRLLQQLWNKCFYRPWIMEHNIRFDESISIGEDTRFLLEYIRTCEIRQLVMVNQALYHYMRDQSGSLMYHVGYEKVEESLKNLRSLYEIAGMKGQQLSDRLNQDRIRQQELYAYLIFHNMGMSRAEKQRLIHGLDQDPKRTKELFRKNEKLFLKEKMYRIFRKQK